MLTLPHSCTLESRQAFPAPPADTVSLSYHFPEADPGSLGPGILSLTPDTVCSDVDGLNPDDFPRGGAIHRTWNETDTRLLAHSTTLPHTRFREGPFFKKEPGPDLLIAHRASENHLRFGPVWILHAEQRLVCCFRTRIPAAVTLTLPHLSVRSETALMHSIPVNGPFDPGPLPFRLSDGETVLFSGHIHPPTSKEPSLFIAGDPAPGTEQWRGTAQVLMTHQPDALLLLGDLVSSGKKEALWQKSFYEPAADLLSCTPLACVFGNHDQQSRRLADYFPHDVTHDLWSIEIGNSRWIGLYSGTPVPGDATAAHLENMLQSHDPEIPVCFCSHYPPYSSSNHGSVDHQNRPTEPACRYAREILLPLLSRRGVRAWFTGHNHVYERSVLPEGLQLITTGGAGGYLYGKTGTPHQNPYSTVFRTGYHVCKVNIRKHGLLLQALDRDGQPFDAVSL
jgi:predicted phosphodiesterase